MWAGGCYHYLINADHKLWHIKCMVLPGQTLLLRVLAHINSKVASRVSVVKVGWLGSTQMLTRAGVDLGIIEWWGCMTNAWKILATPTLLRPHPFYCPGGQQLDCRLHHSLESDFTTCLELDQYCHQPLSYVNHCISMAKHTQQKQVDYVDL